MPRRITGAFQLSLPCTFHVDYYFCSELLAEQEKLKDGARGLKDELERLLKDSEQKKRELKKAEDGYVRQEQANISAAISASAGGTIDEKKRYIGALQEAMKRKLNNLDALHLTVSNYEVLYLYLIETALYYRFVNMLFTLPFRHKPRTTGVPLVS
jgi:hypothetical protein